VEGYDAASKAAILASLAFHTEVPVERVHREGILSVTREQIQSARESGYSIKLLAICERLTDSNGNDGIAVRVHPALIPAKHPLAAVRSAFNAVFVEAESAGQLMFYGAGAGGVQTASAVLGDLVSVAKRHLAGGPGLSSSSHAQLPILAIDQVRTRYQIALEVSDLPGVLAALAGVFSDFGVSVEAVHQTPGDSHTQNRAKLSIMTHEARESELAAVVSALESHQSVHALVSVIRVEGL
jgi:homoserine dehydrogenase